jgi:hypothetical protein
MLVTEIIKVVGHMDSNIILESCTRLFSEITDNVDRKEFFDRCVWDRMSTIYEKEDSEYDDLIGKLEVNIDYHQYNQVKVCIRKLMRIISRNRKHLITTIERLGM